MNTACRARCTGVDIRSCFTLTRVHFLRFASRRQAVRCDTALSAAACWSSSSQRHEVFHLPYASVPLATLTLFLAAAFRLPPIVASVASSSSGKSLTRNVTLTHSHRQAIWQRKGKEGQEQGIMIPRM